jgi:ABC-2 type transport system ATP-binding protein
MNDTGLAIEVKGLVKQYKNAPHPALDSFNLRVRRGEFFGLLGPNGAGKTTALSILCGLLQAEHGVVFILGMDPKQQAKKIKQILSMVPQEIALYKKLTARENLAFFGRLYGRKGKQLENRINRCLEIAGLTDFADRLVSTCSSGMQRRLNLVAALLNEPAVLFLDEPTVGIDAQSRRLIHEQLHAINRQGTTILYTTHYLEEARALCGRIGIMDNGRIIEQGSPDELLSRSNSRTLEELFLRLTGKQLRDA